MAVATSAMRDLQSCLTNILHSQCVPHSPGDGGFHGLPSRRLQLQGSEHSIDSAWSACGQHTCAHCTAGAVHVTLFRTPTRLCTHMAAPLSHSGPEFQGIGVTNPSSPHHWENSSFHTKQGWGEPGLCAASDSASEHYCSVSTFVNSLIALQLFGNSCGDTARPHGALSQWSAMLTLHDDYVPCIVIMLMFQT